jgi:thiaminase (transcriptional activator TenA)
MPSEFASTPAGAAVRLDLDYGLFGRLRREAAAEWESYVRHPFVRALADGSLPEAGFRRYLIQDYLFLIQYARAYALSAFKSASLEDMRAASRTLQAVLDVEMPLHVKYCTGWGLTEAMMAAEPEDLRMLAYTRFFLERGHAGDKLDLEVALAPCVIGYAEIARLLIEDPRTVIDGNPYADWIATYAGDEYQELAARAILQLDELGRQGGAEMRYASLLANFRTAARLEAEFWGIGWPEGAAGPHG